MEKKITVELGCYTVTMTITNIREFWIPYAYALHRVECDGIIYDIDNMSDQIFRIFDAACEKCGIDFFDEMDNWLKNNWEIEPREYIEEIGWKEQAWIDSGMSEEDFYWPRVN